jgi:hypothetical protein
VKTGGAGQDTADPGVEPHSPPVEGVRGRPGLSGLRSRSATTTLACQDGM